MAEKSSIEALLSHLWWLYPRNPIVTMAYCSCGNPARGGNLCPDCTEKELSRLVGKRKAKEYHDLVKEVRKLEKEMK